MTLAAWCAELRSSLLIETRGQLVNSRKSASRFVRAATRWRRRFAHLEGGGKPIIHKGRSPVMEGLWNLRSVQAYTSDRLHISLEYRSFLACRKILDRSLL